MSEHIGREQKLLLLVAISLSDKKLKALGKQKSKAVKQYKKLPKAQALLTPTSACFLNLTGVQGTLS
jgi:hypothetical protein